MTLESWWPKRKNILRIIMQNEAAECGLACLAMIANYHNRHIDLSQVRSKLSVSLRGTSFRHLIHLADAIGLEARPIRAEISQLREVKGPSLLHWGFDHFVVLGRIHKSSAVIFDPARGKLQISLEELSNYFTGALLEITPNASFSSDQLRQKKGGNFLIEGVRRFFFPFLRILTISFLLQIILLAIPLFFKYVLDQSVHPHGSPIFAKLAIGFLLLALIQVILDITRSLGIIFLSANINLDFIRRLFGQLINLPMSYFEKRHLGDIISRFSSVGYIEQTLSQAFAEGFLDGLMALIIVAVMFFYSPILASIILGSTLFWSFLSLGISSRLHGATLKEIVARAKKDTNLLETVRGMQTIKVFSLETMRKTLFDNLLVDYINSSALTQRISMWTRILGAAANNFELVIVIWVGSYLIASNQISIGLFFVFITYKLQFNQRIGSLVQKAAELRMLNLHSVRINDIALHPTEPRVRSALGENCITQGRLDVVGLTYRYSDTEPSILDDVNLTVEAGECVAITGASGCGKTTLVKLMIGILLPQKGAILVDGMDISSVGTDAYRSRIAAVMQDDQLFSGTIAENICLFDGPVDELRLRAACEMSEIYADIQAMPMRLHTFIGDRGEVFSGGQRQRLMLARALYRRPKILFLDEATSHVDLAAERRINNMLRGLNITRVIVAHRQETIKLADRVVQLRKANLDG